MGHRSQKTKVEVLGRGDFEVGPGVDAPGHTARHRMQRVSAKGGSSAAADCARCMPHIVTATGSEGFAGWSAGTWPVASGQSTGRACALGNAGNFSCPLGASIPGLGAECPPLADLRGRGGQKQALSITVPGEPRGGEPDICLWTQTRVFKSQPYLSLGSEWP